MIIENKSDGTRLKTPTGLIQAVCSKVVDIGFQKTYFNGDEKVKHQMIILFELDKRIETEGEYKGQRFIITKKYTVSLHEKANLTKDLNMWRGKPFTKEEAKVFNTDNIIGANAYLTIGEREGSDGNLYPQIMAISPLPAGLPEMKIEFEDIPGWIKKLAEKSTAIEPSKDEFTDDIPF